MNTTQKRAHSTLRAPLVTTLGALVILGVGGACGGQGPSPADGGSAQARVDDHSGHDHGTAPAPAAPSTDAHADPDHDHGDGGPADHAEAAEESSAVGHGGIQVLDTGIDVSSIQLNLEDPVEPAPPTALEPVAVDAQEERPDTGLQKPVVHYLGGISLVAGEQRVHSFGNVREGEAFEKAFQFVSDGKEDLVIKTVKPSCGCTRADIEVMDAEGNPLPYERGNPIPVGTSFQLLTELSTEGKHGHVEATVGLITNDPEGTFNVKLSAEVERVLSLEPDNPSIYFGELSVLDQAVKTTRVKSTRGEPFLLSVDQTTPLPDAVRVEFAPVDPDEDGRAKVWDVTLTMGPGLEEGIRHYPVYLMSDLVIPNPKHPNEDGSPKHFMLPLALQVKVAGLVSATPAYIGFGLVRPGETAERRVIIECHDDFQLDTETEIILEGLYGGESPYPEAFATELVPLPPMKNADGEEEPRNGLELKLVLKGMPEGYRGSFGGRLRVLVNHPAKEEVLLRFSGICRAGLPGTGGN